MVTRHISVALDSEVGGDFFYCPPCRLQDISLRKGTNRHELCVFVGNYNFNYNYNYNFNFNYNFN